MLKIADKETEAVHADQRCRWKNLIFDKAGKTWPGKITFDSQQQAEQAMQKAVLACQRPNSPGYTEWGFPTPAGVLPYSQYAWHLQMPVVEGL